MAANESTKFQVNFKTPDGTLINLYAGNKEELEALLTAAQDFSALIGSVSQSFNGVRNAAPVSDNLNPTPREYAKQFAVTHKPQVVEGETPRCQHGQMQYRNGTGAKGPWRAWMCAAPKGAPDKCDAIWVR